MRKHVITLLALLTVTIGSIGFPLAKDEPILHDWTDSDPPVTNREPCSGIHGGPYPSRLARTVLLPIHDTNVRIGFDCYVDAIKVERHLEYRDGQKETIKFRPNGTVAERTRTYATVSGDIGRLQSHATYAKDGTTYLTHDVYRGDGTLERTGRAERDGRYQTTYFFEDGVTVERRRNFGKLKEFVSETIYRRDGSELAGISVTLEELELGITLYAPNGKKQATFYRTKIGERGYVFAEDGMTAILEYAYDPYSRAAGYMDEKGRLLQKHSMNFNRLVVAFLAKDETRTYTQIRRDNDQVLRQVEERSFQTGELIRTIAMNKDGSRPEVVTYPQGEGKLVKVLDENGMVVKIDHVAKGGTVVRSETPAKLQKEVIPAEALDKPLPTAEQPKFRLYGPPLVYDYP
jgi:hypothetical protein